MLWSRWVLGPLDHTEARAWPCCCQLSHDLGGDRSPDRRPVFSPGHPLLLYSASLPLPGVHPGPASPGWGNCWRRCRCWWSWSWPVKFHMPTSPQILPQTSHVGPAHWGMDPTLATAAAGLTREEAAVSWEAGSCMRPEARPCPAGHHQVGESQGSVPSLFLTQMLTCSLF